MNLGRRAGCICSCWTRSAGLLQPSSSQASLSWTSRRWTSSKVDAVIAEGTADRDATTSAQDVVDEAIDSTGTIEQIDTSDSNARTPGKFPNYSAWLRRDGKAYKRPAVGSTKWLGGNIPFPLNKSFRPPAPIADKQKQKIYDSFARMQKQTIIGGSSEEMPRKSETFYVRQLSQAFGLSLDRIRAIVRLKALEHNIVEQASAKNRRSILQHRFMHGMEQALGVSDSRGALEVYRKAEVRVRGEDNSEDKPYRVGLKSHWVLVDEDDPAAVAQVQALQSSAKTASPVESQQFVPTTPPTRKAVRIIDANPRSNKPNKANVRIHIVDASQSGESGASART